MIIMIFRKKILILILLSTLLFPAFCSATEATINFYYSPSCPHCKIVSEELEILEEKYGENILVNRINVYDDISQFIEIQEEYNVPSERRGGVPKAFFEGTKEYCSGENGCKNSLEETIIKLGVTVPDINSTTDSNSFIPDTNSINDSNSFVIDNNSTNDTNNNIDTNAGTNLNQTNEKINYLQLLGLALVDAVNPCEIAVLIILMTAILTRDPKDKKKALFVGLAFSFAIYAMYFLFGLLIILGFKSVLGLTSLSGSWFYTLLAILAIILGLLNLKDAIWYGGGGFIMEVPLSWRPKMKQIIKETTSVKGAFITGLIVSFFLTPCTAGPYFVAGGILATVSWIEAIIPLLFYLCIFIMPMVAITGVAYCGFAAVDDMGGWRDKNIKLLHWIAGLLLTGLGIAMLLGFI